MDETDGGITVSDWSEPDQNEGNEDDEYEIFVGYFEEDEDDEPNPKDPRLTSPTGIYRNMGRTHTEVTLQSTMIPLSIRIRHHLAREQRSTC